MQWPRTGPEAERMRIEAERVIESSGDGRAIRRLGELRRDPANWTQTLLRMAADSPVLKIALGVFLGILAAEAVRGLMQGDLLDSLSQSVDREITAAGGVDALLSAASLTTGTESGTAGADVCSEPFRAMAADPPEDRLEFIEDEDGEGLDLDLDLPF